MMKVVPVLKKHKKLGLSLLTLILLIQSPILATAQQVLEIDVANEGLESGVDEYDEITLDDSDVHNDETRLNQLVNDLEEDVDDETIEEPNEEEPNEEEPQYLPVGWVLIDDNWFFYNDYHERQMGWLQRGTRWFFLNEETGQMETGWLQRGNQWFFLHETNGHMQTGWLQRGSRWFFFNETSGRMQRGWLQRGNTWFFLHETNGHMLTGWLQRGNHWFFLNETSGRMQTGWLQRGNHWFFLNETSGRMATGWLQRRNQWFFLNETNGRMVSEPVLIGDVWQSFNSNGVWRGRLSSLHQDIEATLRSMVGGRSNIGISYFCLRTGQHISINGNQHFFAASTIKLPTHMMVAEAVRDGQLSWNQRLTVTQGDLVGGSGVLQNHVRVGDTFTLYELMRHSIVYSDNIGHRMITRAVLPSFTPGTGMELTQAVFSRYLPGQAPQGRMMLTANQLTEIFRVLHRDQHQIEGYGIALRYMMNTTWRNRFSTNLTRGHVAHTPGWIGSLSHDSGLFFTEHPYVLVVMTDGAGGARFLSDVAEAVFRLHRQFE